MICDQVLFILPIFAPNKIGYEIQMESLRSFYSYCSFYNHHNLTVILTGWCADELFWDSIAVLSYSRDHNITIIKQDKNYGKAKVVNEAFNKYSNEYKYLMTWDSDIKFDITEEDVISRSFHLAEQIPNFGLISLNQKEYNCHIYSHFTESHVIGTEIVKISEGASGIAGGCLFIACNAFRLVKGYHEFGVYEADDGFLMLDMNTNKKFVAVCDTIRIIHPYDNKELIPGYRKWKQEILNKRRNGTSLSYEGNLKESEGFWNGTC